MGRRVWECDFARFVAGAQARRAGGEAAGRHKVGQGLRLGRSCLRVALTARSCLKPLHLVKLQTWCENLRECNPIPALGQCMSLLTTMTENDIVPQLGHLIIADLDFVVDSAQISERTDADGQRRWDVWIGTVERRLEHTPDQSFRWAPNIRGEWIRVEAPPLNDIVGKTISVPDAYDTTHDEYLFSMYVFEHSDVSSSMIRFVERRDDYLRVEWRGRCDIHFDATYGENIPFALLADFQVCTS